MLQLFPFLLIIVIIVIITIVFFLFSHYLTLVSDYFYLSLLSIIILLLLYLFSSLLFISHFKFIFVPFFFLFSSFFAVFFPFGRQISLSCASSAGHYIQFYPYWPFENPPRRTLRPSKLSAKLKSLSFCCCVIIRLELHGQFHTLCLSTLRYLTD